MIVGNELHRAGTDQHQHQRVTGDVKTDALGPAPGRGEVRGRHAHQLMSGCAFSDHREASFVSRGPGAIVSPVRRLSQDVQAGAPGGAGWLDLPTARLCQPAGYG